jgi:protein TonB
MDISALPFSDEPKTPLAMRVPTLVAVLGMHAALLACVLQARFDVRPETIPVPLDVSIIQAPPSLLPQAANAVTAQPPRPAAPAVVRRMQPDSPQTPVSTSTAEVNPAPSVPAAIAGATATATEEVAAASPAPAPATAGVSPAHFDADYLKNPPPEYPAISRRLREEGTVTLVVTVTAKGDAGHVEVKDGSGFPRLDKAALFTVQKWRFVPARHGDDAISANVIVPIVFSLDS